MTDSVIVSGEPGHGAPPMQAKWVRNVQEQCDTAGVLFFFNQWALSALTVFVGARNLTAEISTGVFGMRCRRSPRETLNKSVRR
jgi:protein gp37